MSFCLILIGGSCDPTSYSSTSSSNCTTCKIFVTASTYDGNPGGASGADANYPGSWTYKAFIVDGTNRIASVTSNSGDGQVDWVLKANTDYTRLDGTAIMTTNANSIFVFGTLTNSFASSDTGYYTGLWSYWSVVTTAHCSSWTSNSGASSARLGDQTSTSSSSIQAFGVICSSIQNLVCIEQ